MDIFTDVPNDVISDTVDRWIKGSRNREIMKDRLIDAMTYERIAEKHELFARYVKALVYKLEDRVFDHIWK